MSTAVDPFAAPAPVKSDRAEASASVDAAETQAEQVAGGSTSSADTGAGEDKGVGKQSGKASGEGARARGLAVAGKTPQVPGMPSLPQWVEPSGADETYVPDEEYDANDLSDVNREINRTKSRLFRVGNLLADANRAHAEAVLTYDRQYRRALIGISGGSAETRKALAELQCEDFENDVLVTKQVAERLKELANAVRRELDAVQNQSHNVRAMLGIR